MKEKISVKNFVEEFLNRKVVNNKINPTAEEDFIREKLDIIEYLPFDTKREIIEMIVEKTIRIEDGVKHTDGIAQFLSFIVSMIMSHTNLEFSDNVSEDYDLLSKYGLLEKIVTMFKKDVDECDALLKTAVADAMADNNLNVIIGKFLNGVLNKLDGVGNMIKGFTENLDLSKLLGANMNEEEKAKILGVIDKLK